MRVFATTEAVDYVRHHGGHVFVWPLDMDAPTGGAVVFALEASTESPGPDGEFARFVGDGFDVLFETTEHGVPDELHIALRGWRRKRLRAYWNGNSFARS